MVNTVRAQVSTMDDKNQMKDDILNINNIKTDKFDEETDSAVYKTVLDKYSTEELKKNFVDITQNNTFDDTEKKMLIENLKFLIEKKTEQEEKQNNEEEEELQEIQNNKTKQKEEDLQQVDELKKLLAEKDDELSKKDERISTMENDINLLREQLRELSDKNHDALEALRDAKKNRNQEIIDEQRKTILRLIEEKRALNDRYTWKLPKYEWNIQTMETKRIELRWFGSDSVDWQRVLTWPQLRFRQNLRSRRRINTTVNKLNEIWNDPKKWVNFVLTRTFGYDPLSISWKVWTWFKNMRKFFKIRDIKTFDEMYNKQKKYFIDNLESKMAANSMSANDKKVIAAIKNRLDYYQAAYKRQFITA